MFPDAAIRRSPPTSKWQQDNYGATKTSTITMSFHQPTPHIAAMDSSSPDKAGRLTGAQRQEATIVGMPVTKATPFAKSWAHLVAGGYVLRAFRASNSQFRNLKVRVEIGLANHVATASQLRGVIFGARRVSKPTWPSQPGPANLAMPFLRVFLSTQLGKLTIHRFNSIASAA